MIKRLDMLVHRAGGQIFWQPLFTFNTARLVCIRGDQAGVNSKAAPTDQTLIHAALKNSLKQMAKQTTLAETAPLGDAGIACRATRGGSSRTPNGLEQQTPNQACKTSGRPD